MWSFQDRFWSVRTPRYLNIHTEHSSTLIDLALTTDTGKVADSGVIDYPISDHSLIYVIRRAKTPRGKIKTIKCRNFKAYSTDKLVTDLHAASWDEVDTSLTVDDAWASFKNTCISIADKHAPLQTKRVRGNTLP